MPLKGGPAPKVIVTKSFRFSFNKPGETVVSVDIKSTSPKAARKEAAALWKARGLNKVPGSSGFLYTSSGEQIAEFVV